MANKLWSCDYLSTLIGRATRSKRNSALSEATFFASASMSDGQRHTSAGGKRYNLIVKVFTCEYVGFFSKLKGAKNFTLKRFVSRQESAQSSENLDEAATSETLPSTPQSTSRLENASSSSPLIRKSPAVVRETSPSRQRTIPTAEKSSLSGGEVEAARNGEKDRKMKDSNSDESSPDDSDCEDDEDYRKGMSFIVLVLSL